VAVISATRERRAGSSRAVSETAEVILEAVVSMLTEV
jgi:hypothetical protein